jgi:uncharacterized protein (TIGR02722 family)
MKITLTPFAVLGLLIASCTGIKYDDPGKVETLTIDYGSTDLQTLSAEMVDSLTAAPSLNYIDNPGKENDPRVIVVFGGIENRTSEHIDTEGIADKIQTSLLKSGKFRFLATTRDKGQDEIEEQVRFQQGSGRVRDDQMRAYGKQLGADVILYGTLRSIEKGRPRSIESGGKKKEDVYYNFTLKCVNIDTSEIVWQDEAELRKTARTGFFGRS